MKMKKAVARTAVGLSVALLLAQVVPYGRDHDNPPVTSEPVWDSPRTRELAKRACFDCHSNETRWPWYASVAPFSWRVQSHVDEGRDALNFSAFDRSGDEAEEAAELVEEGEMPLWDYLLAHPEARLTVAESSELIRGLRATFGSRDHGSRDGVEREEDEEG